MGGPMASAVRGCLSGYRQARRGRAVANRSGPGVIPGEPSTKGTTGWSAQQGARSHQKSAMTGRRGAELPACSRAGDLLGGKRDTPWSGMSFFAEADGRHPSCIQRQGAALKQQTMTNLNGIQMSSLWKTQQRHIATGGCPLLLAEVLRTHRGCHSKVGKRRSEAFEELSLQSIPPLRLSAPAAR